MFYENDSIILWYYKLILSTIKIQRVWRLKYYEKYSKKNKILQILFSRQLGNRFNIVYCNRLLKPSFCYRYRIGY